MKYIPFFLILMLSYLTNACLKVTSPTPDDPKQTPNEWRAEAALPEYLRIGGMVHQTSDKVYLLPGGGAYHFASIPEIMSFDGEKWTYEFRYDGFASAGGGYWQYNGLAYNVCGLNGSGAPTQEVVAIDFETQSTHLETQFLPARVSSLSSCSTPSKGYLTANFSYNTPLHKVYFYDFDTQIWDSIPKPVENETSPTLLAAQSDTLFLFYPTSEQHNLFYKTEGVSGWNPLPDFPGTLHNRGVFHQYKNYLIVGTGIDLNEQTNLLSDIWAFNINTSQWTAIAPYPGKALHSGFIFELNDRLYIGGGATSPTISNEVMNGEMWSIYLE